jgi:hypothetical protein
MKKSRARNAKNLKRKGGQKQQSSELLANHELVVIAAYLAGAQSSSIDTEDIAVKANELAPGRFTWRKYVHQINIDTVRKRLWDASNTNKGGYLIGSEKIGWRLTKAGFDFARRKMKRGGLTKAPKQRTSQNERAAQSREIRRMTHEDAYIKFVSGLSREITKSEAERFFRIDDYITGKMRIAKVERFRIIANNNEKLLRAIEFISSFVRED